MTGLGELGFVDAIIGGALRAGGEVTSAFLVVDAQKYAAKTANKTALQVALSQERIAYAHDRALTDLALIETGATTRQVERTVSTGAWALVAIAALVVLAGD